MVDDRIDKNVDGELLGKNIVEVEKLFENGFNLPVGFLISSKNIGNEQWVTSLAKKRKAIHSGIFENY